LPIIESKVAVTVKYMPRNMFISHCVHERKAEEEIYAFDNGKNNRAYEFHEHAKAKWAFLSKAE